MGGALLLLLDCFEPPKMVEEEEEEEEEAFTPSCKDCIDNCAEIAEHIICEAEFQIMAAKTVLHNIDEVFPEIAAHLQTIRASRYLLRQEESKIKKYLRSGELSNKEHDNLLATK